MSPIVHTGAALWGWQLTADKKNTKTLLLFMLAANLPDIDFLFFLFIGKKAFSIHQFYTHNIFFVALGVALLLPLLKTKKERLGLALTAVSHLVLDLMTRDIADPVGFRLFFPLSDQLFHIGFFPNLMKGSLTEIFSIYNLQVICLEFTVGLLPVVLVFRKELIQFVKSGFHKNARASASKGSDNIQDIHDIQNRQDKDTHNSIN